jgi:AcrR family transcriptional regulator
MTTTTKLERPTSIAAEDRAAEIFRKAAKLMCRQGFDATSMKDIADAVSMTKAGLYYYTQSKHDLLYRIIDFAMQTVESEVVTPCREIDDPRERIEAMIRRHVQVVTDDSEALSILTDEVHCLPEPQRDVILRRKRSYLDFVRSSLEELKQQGRLRDLDTTIAAFNLFAIVLGIARWHRSGGRLSDVQIADEICAFILGGLLVY